jgi:ribosomal protein S18 acetylase RimI-like enzyme
MDDRIRKFLPEDTSRVVPHLVRTFQDDTFMNWLVMEHARNPKAANLFFKTCLETLCAPYGETLVTADCTGAAMWYPPGTHQIGPITQLKLLPKMIRAGGIKGLVRLVKVIDRLDRVHPRESHFYLHFIGIDPKHRGQGLGTALMKPVLEKCDRKGCGAYLENTNQENHSFYASLGFRIKEKIIVQKGAPPLWAMWRNPLKSD